MRRPRNDCLAGHRYPAQKRRLYRDAQPYRLHVQPYQLHENEQRCHRHGPKRRRHCGLNPNERHHRNLSPRLRQK
jgi:hypothetical protein